LKLKEIPHGRRRNDACVSDLPFEEETVKIFLSIAAVLAWLFGAVLLLAPGPFYAPTGLAMPPMVATVAQAHGATLVGLGVITWMARGANRQGLRPVLTGNLVVQILSLGVAIRTVMLGAGESATPSILIHVVLGVLFLYFLLQTKKLPA
ncbi:MAG TPA: hypothetical protein VK201_08345, partial [bacterium]|nr:hypothetical protein [bacterium]